MANLVDTVTKLLDAKLIARLTAMYVIIYGTNKLFEDIGEGFTISSSAETVMVLLVGGASIFLWKSCTE